MNVGHKLAPLFPCTIPSCWTYYQSKNGLKGHCRHLHSNLLSCSLCNHVAVGTTALQEHEHNHSEKKFPCDVCNQGFSSCYDMRRHFEKCPKNPERKISCKQCTSVGAHVEVSGGISGIITHCIQEHGLKVIGCVPTVIAYIHLNVALKIILRDAVTKIKYPRI